MSRHQQGFTLIELVVVLVLLGIVGAAATARFQDMSTNAALVAVRGVAAELSSAAAINYAASVVGTEEVTLSGAATDCSANTGTEDVEDLFQSGAPPTGYTLSGTGDCSTAGDTITCTVTHTATTLTADATIICTG